MIPEVLLLQAMEIEDLEFLSQKFSQIYVAIQQNPTYSRNF